MANMVWRRARGSGLCFLRIEGRRIATVIPTADGSGYRFWVRGMAEDSAVVPTEDEALDRAWHTICNTGQE